MLVTQVRYRMISYSDNTLRHTRSKKKQLLIFDTGNMDAQLLKLSKQKDKALLKEFLCTVPNDKVISSFFLPKRMRSKCLIYYRLLTLSKQSFVSQQQMTATQSC
jgi:hypothetical protein